MHQAWHLVIISIVKISMCKTLAILNPLTLTCVILDCWPDLLPRIINVRSNQMNTAKLEKDLNLEADVMTGWATEGYEWDPYRLQAHLIKQDEGADQYALYLAPSSFVRRAHWSAPSYLVYFCSQRAVAHSTAAHTAMASRRCFGPHQQGGRRGSTSCPGARSIARSQDAGKI